MFLQFSQIFLGDRGGFSLRDGYDSDSGLSYGSRPPRFASPSPSMGSYTTENVGAFVFDKNVCKLPFHTFFLCLILLKPMYTISPSSCFTEQNKTGRLVYILVVQT